MLPKKVVTLQLEGDKTPSAHKIFINNVIIFMNFTLLITVMLTAVTLVVAAYVIAKRKIRSEIVKSDYNIIARLNKRGCVQAT